jgi:hypothetical protein
VTPSGLFHDPFRIGLTQSLFVPAKAERGFFVCPLLLAKLSTLPNNKAFRRLPEGFVTGRATAIKKSFPIKSGSFSFRDPVWIQTRNLLIRSQMLYSIELRGHVFREWAAKIDLFAIPPKKIIEKCR